MTRNQFIKSFSLLAASPFLGSLNAHATEVEPTIWEQLVDYAKWSPSPHNVQSWKLRVIDSTSAELLYDVKRLLPATDPNTAFCHVGMAIFIEYLSIAANKFGLTLNISDVISTAMVTNGSGLQHYAHLILVPNAASKNNDAELIKQRRTSRADFETKTINENVLNELTTVSKKLGFNLRHSQEEVDIKKTIELNTLIMFEDIDDDATRNELCKWIRTNKSEASYNKDGLWSQCLMFPDWLVEQFFFHHNRFKAGWKRRELSKIHQRSMQNTKTIIWFQNDFSTVADWQLAGKLLAHFWLTLTKNNVYMHPFGSVVTNPKAHQQFVEHFKLNEENGKLFFIARLGYSPVPPASFRLDTKDLFVS
jgi:hypothetical protein